MNEQELLKDWYFRYHIIYGKRYTRKQKDRFLDSLAADVRQIRNDFQVDTFKLNAKDRNEYRNLYVGNPQKADTIICTYYDTPIARFSPYHFFDLNDRKKKITNFILLTSILFIIVGLLFTIFVAIPVFQSYGAMNIRFLGCILFYILYFSYLNKITRGWPNRNNLIQNTSSVLLLLLSLTTFKSKRIAFAFVDAGCTNNAGLERVMEQNKAKIIMLDSIGANTPLHLVDENRGSVLLENLQEALS